MKETAATGMGSAEGAGFTTAKPLFREDESAYRNAASSFNAAENTQKAQEGSAQGALISASRGLNEARDYAEESSGIKPQFQHETESCTQPSFAAEKAEQLSALPEKPPKPMKIFGAVFDTFILIEYEDNLLLVDQHAVHERLLYEKLMKRFEGHLGGQELLIPIVVSVNRHEQDILEENRELLEAIGMTIESFGEHDVAIRSVPVVLGENESEVFLREAIVELEAGREPGADKKRAAILQMACKHAVKGGEPLSESDLRYLVEQMIDQKVTPTCPHGRPLVVSISHVELDKKFKRIQ